MGSLELPVLNSHMFKEFPYLLRFLNLGFPGCLSTLWCNPRAEIVSCHQPQDHTRVSSKFWHGPGGRTTNQLIDGLTPRTTSEPAFPTYRNMFWRFLRVHLCKVGTHCLLFHRTNRWDNGLRDLPFTSASTFLVASQQEHTKVKKNNTGWKLF